MSGPNTCRFPTKPGRIHIPLYLRRQAGGHRPWGLPHRERAGPEPGPGRAKGGTGPGRGENKHAGNGWNFACLRKQSARGEKTGVLSWRPPSWGNLFPVSRPRRPVSSRGDRLEGKGLPGRDDFEGRQITPIPGKGQGSFRKLAGFHGSRWGLRLGHRLKRALFPYFA